MHLITNNQIGFTTDPDDARSTRWASDLAKGFDVPIIHVNADDVAACMSAVRLAFAFREEFGHDVLIDLIGYRRFGHNESDEPAYTQPEMYAKIKAHKRVAELWAERLIADGSRHQGAGRPARAGRLGQPHAACTSASRAGSPRPPSTAPPSTGTGRIPARPLRQPRRADRRARRSACASSARSCCARPRASPCTRSSSSSSSAGATRSTARSRRSTGRTPRRSRSRRC